jgi:hypothetical protein
MADKGMGLNYETGLSMTEPTGDGVDQQTMKKKGALCKFVGLPCTKLDEARSASILVGPMSKYALKWRG